MALTFKTYRTEDIDANLRQMRICPLDVMVVGATGAGKSTTLNAFFQRNIARVGTGVDPETMELESYKLNDFFRVWDTPGLGDGVKNDQIHKKKIIDLLYKDYTLDGKTYGLIDMAVVIVEGINRDMGTTYSLLNEVIVPNIQNDRIFVIINQADVALKGRHWNYDTNSPDAQLISYLDQQAISIQRRVKEATGVSIEKPVYYSAEFGWNVQAVLDFIIDHMPKCRRELFR